MTTLGLEARDVVDISFVRIKLAGLVVFQPCSLAWDTLVESGGKDPKTILEHEINKYSSLTAGSTIYIEHEGQEYPLYVSETRSEAGVAVRGVRVQDSDVKVDIDRSRLDKLVKAIHRALGEETDAGEEGGVEEKEEGEVREKEGGI